MKKKQTLKSGEKILFIIFGVFFVLAVIAYIGLESVRLSKEEPMFKQTTFFDFSEVGKEGSKIYREARCNSCHRALRTGTSMGLILDGIGSKRDADWIESFLLRPEDVYGAQTLDHGIPPKEAAYVSRMPKDQIRKMAVFLSELKADAGSSVAKVPPPERSEFIDNMVKVWAPKEWKDKYQDIRDKPPIESGEALQE
ncbi:MAG: cytochrome c [Gammaproteobacteria bacterium]|nr:cytochrome c [Gammaproteobacteria bacterium]MDH5731908.1 cytochrome c [Gammaproteobacteria bacterium]